MIDSCKNFNVSSSLKDEILQSPFKTCMNDLIDTAMHLITQRIYFDDCISDELAPYRLVSTLYDSYVNGISRMSMVIQALQIACQLSNKEDFVDHLCEYIHFSKEHIQFYNDLSHKDYSEEELLFKYIRFDKEHIQFYNDHSHKDLSQDEQLREYINSNKEHIRLFNGLSLKDLREEVLSCTQIRFDKERIRFDSGFSIEDCSEGVLAVILLIIFSYDFFTLSKEVCNEYYSILLEHGWMGIYKTYI